MKQLSVIQEIWKPCIEYDGYEVSNLGRVRNIDKEILNQYLTKKGYYIIKLFGESNSVHRLVLGSFIPNPNNLPQVNHIDGDKQNNILSNLEWCDNSYNQLHAYRLGLQPSRYGENNSKAKLKESDISYIKEIYNSGKKIEDIANEMNVNISTIQGILAGKIWNKNKDKVEKRDDRSFWSEDRKKDSIISKFNSKSKRAIIPVEQCDVDGNKIATFKSVNRASISTGIPKSSITSVLHKYKFYNKDKTKYFIMELAGGYKWKKAELILEEFKKLL